MWVIASSNTGQAERLHVFYWMKLIETIKFQLTVKRMAFILNFPFSNRIYLFSENEKIYAMRILWHGDIVRNPPISDGINERTNEKLINYVIEVLDEQMKTFAQQMVSTRNCVETIQRRVVCVLCLFRVAELKRIIT